MTCNVNSTILLLLLLLLLLQVYMHMNVFNYYHLLSCYITQYIVTLQILIAHPNVRELADLFVIKHLGLLAILVIISIH